MLNDKDLNILNDKLYVPGAVRDLMEHANPLNPDTQYRLHEILSNFQPDSALIAIAMATKEIIRFQGYHATALKSLDYTCSRIIEEYGSVWLEHARNQKIDDTLLFETLAQIPDDLAELAELLDINAAMLKHTDAKAVEILNILKLQAGAHAVIAEEFVDVMENVEAETTLSVPIEIFNNNVIQFPVTTARVA